MTYVEIAAALIQLVLGLVDHQTATDMISADAKKRANDAADAVAAARGLK